MNGTNISNKEKRILICTYAEMPNGSATAVRINIFVDMFLRLGFTPTIITMNSDKKVKLDIINCNFRKYSRGTHLAFLNYFYYKTQLKQILVNEKFDVILNCGMPFPSLLYVKNYAKKKSIRLIHDAIDWFSARQFKFGYFSLLYIFTNINFRYVIDESIYTISISKFFEYYFKDKGIKTIYIPFVLDFSQNCFTLKQPKADFFTFIYAGRPGKKDLLIPFFDGLLNLRDNELAKIRVKIYGVEQTYLDELSSIKKYTRLSKTIRFYGDVSREEVLKAYSDADFSILIRDSKARYSKAGFPTKLSESLYLGIPIFGNLSSDMNLYLKDKYNAMIISDYDSTTVADKIREILSLGIDERKRMYKNSYHTAVKNFNALDYLPQLKSIVD